LCGAQASELIRARDLNRRVSKESFEYLRCRQCDSVSLRNVPTDLGRYYPSSYYDVPSSLADLDARTGDDQYKVELIQRWVRSGRLLEIGPAYGIFARVAQRAGFQVDTIEMDERCCTFLREVVKVGSTQSEDVVQSLGGIGEVDVIAMWHVLEHLPNPWEAIAAAAGQLRPGGILVLATPNPRALQFRLFGRFWSHLDAPRHLHLLSLSAVTERGRAVGLEPVFTTATDYGSLGWNSFGWATTLRNFFRARAVRSAAYLVGRLVNKLVAPLERRDLLGSAYTIVLRRPASTR
jgi:2-polyprenyl-3-methyl-5-hydroxy-6-metoxy-1,4-benzoquinol methylase